MIRDKINLDQATELYSESFLTIYFPSTSLYDLPDIPGIKEYAQNYIDYAKENKRSSIENLLSLLAPEYEIEIEMPFDDKTGTFSWVRLFGVKNPDYKTTSEKEHRGWVYLLTNPAYPELIKIGKAVTPSKRINGINSAGTVSEWELKAAMPVTDDYKVENLMHRELEQYRRKSDQGSSREFFEVSMSVAIKTLLEISKPFTIGDLKLY
tara:strand:+ start:2418 stop:3044 length:627 start_codon:yes stop_codon:yes gene_type:complete